MNNKEKNIKVRIEETGYDNLSNIANHTESTKSAVLRNSIPEIVTSKEFENLLTVHNLMFLEKKANECLEFFMDGHYFPIEKVSESFPAFVMDDDILCIKYPTYKVVFPPNVEEKEIDDILGSLNLNKNDYFKYLDNIMIRQQEGNHVQKTAYFLLGSRDNLESNKKLTQKIIEEFDAHFMKCTVFPAYYLKPFKLKLNENKDFIEGIIQ